jgi:hypothetical protein
LERKALNEKSDREFPIWNVSLAVIAVLLALVAYQAAMRNYFTGDDFLYIGWLNMAAADPSRLWSVFWSNSLDATVTRFYRPLLSLSMALDQQIWGRNAFGFHLTNLFFHSACTVSIYFIVKDVLLPRKYTPSFKLWPVFAAGLFLLYPLHPEVVTWIGGRVDCVATAFVLGSFYGYARWRQSKKRVFLWSGIVCFLLALCSKEFAIVLPAMLVLYEFFLGAPSRSLGHLSKRALRAVPSTVPFWFILALYFVVRRIALGTFVGGYDDRLSIDIDVARLLQQWLNSVGMLCVPINVTMLTPRTSYPLLIWLVAIAASLLSLIKFDLIARDFRPVLNFLVCTFILFLLPVYKLLAIAGDLQSSRLGYFATVPLCCLLSLGLCALIRTSDKNANRGLPIAFAIASAFLIMNAFWLHLNNKAWGAAGTASNNIQQEFAKMSSEGIKNSIVFGAPDSKNGAYICRNAFHTMHSGSIKILAMPSPFVSQTNGALKDAIMRRTSDALYVWDDRLLKLVKCVPLAPYLNAPVKYSGFQLETKFPEENKDRFDANGLKLDDGKVKTLKLFSPDRQLGFDVLVLNVMSDAEIKPSSMFVIYHNDLDGLHSVQGHSINIDSRETTTKTVVFPLRGQPGWLLDGSAHTRLLFVPNTKNISHVRSVSLAPIVNYAPRLTSDGYDVFGPEENDHLPGEFRLDSEHNSRTFNFDATKIGGAEGVIVEVSQPYIPFRYSNAAVPSKDETMRSIRIGSTEGHFALTSLDFDMSAPYYVRVWATDKSGKIIGLSSDQMKVLVTRK